MNKGNIACFIIAAVIIGTLLIRNFSSVNEYYSSPNNTTTESYSDLPTDPIEFAKQLQAKIEKKYPGITNGVHSSDQYDMARADILNAYSMKDCLLKLGNVCFKNIVKIDRDEYMPYQECVQDGESYGIKYCHASFDSWAGLVKKCGSTKNLPTLHELQMLADYLYDIKTQNCTDLDGNAYFECKGKFHEGLTLKEDNDLVQAFLLYYNTFLPLNGAENLRQKQRGFSIPSGEERNGTYVYGWGFGRDGTSYEADYHKMLSDDIGLCVSRD